jgi:hypothetical protein
MKTLKVLLSVLLLGLMIFPFTSVFAEVSNTTYGGMLEANIQQLEIIKQIWGKPISIAEYYNLVYPGELANILKGLPQDMHKYLYDTQWQWPSIPNLSAADVLVSNNYRSSLYLSHGVMDVIVNVDMYTAPPFVPAAGRVTHGCLVITTPSTTMPYLSFSSYLNSYDNGLVHSFTEWKVFASSLNKTQDYYTTYDDLYCNTSSCTFISPPGYTPASGTFTGGSGWWWLTP